jgi:hypothetical protein
LLPPLFKTTEGVVIGFPIFAWAPKKNNKNSGKKMKFGPPPTGPRGAIFRGFLENFRRRSVRVLKLHRGCFLTKKEILATQKIRRPSLAPLGAVFRFFNFFVVENFKICSRVPKLWI